MVFIIIGSILLGLLLIIIILSIVGYKVVFYSPIKGQNSDFNKVKKVNYNGISHKVNESVNQILKIPYEDLYIKSYDGLKFHAYFYRSEGSNEYCGTLLSADGVISYEYEVPVRNNFDSIKSQKEK